MTRLPKLYALLSSLVAASAVACGPCPEAVEEIVVIDPQTEALAESFQRCELDAADCDDLCRGVYKLMYGAEAAEYVYFAECELVEEDEGPAVRYQVSQQCVGGRLPAGAALVDEQYSTTEAGAWFAKLAELEEASVYAFVMLSKELRQLGAPTQLAERCLAAAADEVHHARLITELARRYGAEVGPIAAPALAEGRSLAEVAVENSREGCVRETFGALIALYQGQHSRDAMVRQVMSQIAVDESRHAELSADIDSWARSVLDAAQCAELDEVKQGAIAKLRASLDCEVSDELVATVGLPSAALSRALFQRAEQSLWAI